MVTLRPVIHVFFCIGSSISKYVLVNPLETAGDVRRWVHNTPTPSPCFMVSTRPSLTSSGPPFYPLGEGFSGFPRALLYPDALRTGTARHSAFSDTFKMLRFACVPPQSEEVVIYTHSVPCFISWAPRMPSLYLCAPQNL